MLIEEVLIEEVLSEISIHTHTITQSHSLIAFDHLSLYIQKDRRTKSSRPAGLPTSGPLLGKLQMHLNTELAAKKGTAISLQQDLLCNYQTRRPGIWGAPWGGPIFGSRCRSVVDTLSADLTDVTLVDINNNSTIS